MELKPFSVLLHFNKFKFQNRIGRLSDPPLTLHHSNIITGPLNSLLLDTGQNNFLNWVFSPRMLLAAACVRPLVVRICKRCKLSQSQEFRVTVVSSGVGRWLEVLLWQLWGATLFICFIKLQCAPMRYFPASVQCSEIMSVFCWIISFLHNSN